MNLNPIKQIYAFNRDKELLEQGYSDERECAFPIEEALEGFSTADLAEDLHLPIESSPKEISRELISRLRSAEDIPDVDRLDKHLDIIVFSFGSIFKLHPKMTPQVAMKCLGIVMEANMTKSNQTDSAGKTIKGDNFVPPEVRLQEVLDSLDKE